MGHSSFQSKPLFVYFCSFHMTNMCLAMIIRRNFVFSFWGPREDIFRSSLAKSTWVCCMWPDLSKFCHFSKNWETFGHTFKVYFIFGKVVNPLWDNMYAFWQIFFVLNGQIFQNLFGHMVTLDSACIVVLGSF